MPRYAEGIAPQYEGADTMYHPTSRVLTTMYHPTSRVLTTLEILQTRAIVSGTELAARLEVDARTVRSYITMLRDMGIPVEAQPGRHGGYRLRPGFRLPPMML